MDPTTRQLMEAFVKGQRFSYPNGFEPDLNDPEVRDLDAAYQKRMWKAVEAMKALKAAADSDEFDEVFDPLLKGDRDAAVAAFKAMKIWNYPYTSPYRSLYAALKHLGNGFPQEAASTLEAGLKTLKREGAANEYLDWKDSFQKAIRLLKAGYDTPWLGAQPSF